MKKIVSLLFCLNTISLSYGQKFPVDSILLNGNSANRINIVLLADGYTASEQSKFISDARTITAKFLQTSPYKEYKNYFNVFAIKVVSNQSGASHPANSSDGACGAEPLANVDNYFGSSFDAGGSGYHRLLVPTRYASITSVLATNFPGYDQALLVVNTPYYGGSGGNYAVTSMHISASEIAIHEVGHSFAFLADEYWAGSVYATNAKPNMTNIKNPATNKWKAWLNVNFIGIFPHEENPTWFRPHQNCKMRFLGQNFCSVCKEAHVEKIHDLTRTIEVYSPSNETIISDMDKLKFALTLIKPLPNTLQINWTLNGVLLSEIADNIQLKPAQLLNGKNTLIATINDTTLLSKSATHNALHIEQVKWTLDKTINGLETKATLSETKLMLFPNPAVHELHVAYELQETSELLMLLQDMNGQTVYSRTITMQEGSHQTDIPLSTLPKGYYHFQFIKDALAVANELILVQ